MNAEQFEDFKQFIVATNSQTEARLMNEINQLRRDINLAIGQLRDDMNEGFLAVGDALEEIHRHLDEQDKHTTDLDKRVTKFERQIAYR